MGEHPQELLAHGRQPTSCYHHYKRTSRNPRICRYLQEIRDGALKLSNRRIPNGTYGGVRGRKSDLFSRTFSYSIEKLGYYCTESSEHNAEYNPFYIKNAYPELIERFNIPLDEYPRRCIEQMNNWEKHRKEILEGTNHQRSHEYASYIMEAIVSNTPYLFGGNVMNTGLIENLPADACVEVPCAADNYGIRPCHVGKLPLQLAAMNMLHVNVHLLTIEAAVSLKKEHIYHAAMLDPHAAAELSIDDIIKMTDELIAAHGDWLPKFK